MFIYFLPSWSVLQLIRSSQIQPNSWSVTGKKSHSEHFWINITIHGFQWGFWKKLNMINQQFTWRFEPVQLPDIIEYFDHLLCVFVQLNSTLNHIFYNLAFYCRYWQVNTTIIFTFGYLYKLIIWENFTTLSRSIIWFYKKTKNVFCCHCTVK